MIHHAPFIEITNKFSISKQLGVFIFIIRANVFNTLSTHQLYRHLSGFEEIFKKEWTNWLISLWLYYIWLDVYMIIYNYMVNVWLIHFMHDSKLLKVIHKLIAHLQDFTRLIAHLSISLCSSKVWILLEPELAAAKTVDSPPSEWDQTSRAAKPWNRGSLMPFKANMFFLEWPRQMSRETREKRSLQFGAVSSW